MNTEITSECLNLALQGKISFPETVKRLAATGVERYRADLVRMEKTHYGINGENHVEQFTIGNAPEIAGEFSAQNVKQALTGIQQGAIDYPEFLRRIMSAGVTEYSVWLRGAKAIYFGRTGDFYIEPFPTTK